MKNRKFSYARYCDPRRETVTLFKLGTDSSVSNKARYEGKPGTVSLFKTMKGRILSRFGKEVWFQKGEGGLHPKLGTGGGSQSKFVTYLERKLWYFKRTFIKIALFPLRKKVHPIKNFDTRQLGLKAGNGGSWEVQYYLQYRYFWSNFVQEL